MVELIVVGITLYAIAVVAEQYVKRYHKEVWKEMNRWG